MAVVSDDLLFQAFHRNPSPLFVTRLEDGRFLDCNEAFLKAIGATRENVIGRTSVELGLWDRNPLTREWLRESLLEKGALRELDARIAARNGEIRDGLFSLELIWYQDAQAILGTYQDITERKKAEAAVRKERDFSAAVLDTVEALVLVLDAQGRIVRFNRACERLTGYTFDQVQGKCVWDLLLKPEETEQVKDVFFRLRAGDFPSQYENHWVTRDGEQRLISWSNTALVDEAGEIEYIVPTGVDITDRRRAEARLLRLANYDPLTGLPNRNLFQEYLQHTLEHSHRHKRSMAVLFLDLDDFKLINDTLGHPAGDLMLEQVGERLKNAIGEADTVARLGGDEFTIILEEIAGPDEAADVASRILGELAAPYDIRNSETYSTASIGISIYPSDGGDAETLLKNADAAMYRSKALGPNSYQFFTADMNERASARLTLERELRGALARDELVLHYQPQVELASGRLAGMEALVRWEHPRRGMVAPGEFIPLAEKTRLILPIGQWVLEQACAQLQQWRAEGVKVPHIAVNLSGRQLQQPGLVENIGTLLARYRLSAESLVLEITESVLVGEYESQRLTLQQLEALGVGLSIDDFGTGYSSLSYLKRLPISSLKVDRSFIMDIPHDADDIAICMAVVAMAHHLDIHVIAEGVETPEQLEFLQGTQCDGIQGFLFGRPVPAEEVMRVLEDGGLFARAC